MNKYTVTIQLGDRDQFQHFIDTVGPIVERVVISVQAQEEAQAPYQAPPAPTKVRAPRGSKVNNTILAALDKGPQTVKQLKDALEAANLAAGSLSTGLAALQRAGEVERVGEGLYGRKMQAAAE